jgi:hypothetical protein
MPADNLDDLFRQHLGGHATPPSGDLPRRLAELAEAERLDALFRTGLAGHASQPRRAVWERLEDEHLHSSRPRRRVAAWWQLSAAAVLLLSLLAGGLLWQRGGAGRPGSAVATRHPARAAAGHKLPAAPAEATPAATNPLNFSNNNTTDNQAIAGLSTGTVEKNEKFSARQATAPGHSPSSHPIATTTPAGRTAKASRVASGPHRPGRPLDAAASQLASTGGRPTPASQPAPPAVSPAPSPNPALLAAMTSESEVVEVEVRRGPATPASPSPAVGLASTPAAEHAAPPRRRLRLGGLLRQADHLVHGEPVSLAEATGLAETVTVQARLGGRTLSRTIRL